MAGLELNFYNNLFLCGTSKTELISISVSEYEAKKSTFAALPFIPKSLEWINLFSNGNYQFLIVSNENMTKIAVFHDSNFKTPVISISKN